LFSSTSGEWLGEGKVRSVLVADKSESLFGEGLEGDGVILEELGNTLAFGTADDFLGGGSHLDVFLLGDGLHAGEESMVGGDELFVPGTHFY